MTLNKITSQKVSLFIIALIGILYNFVITYGYTMDDALITLRYSLNFASSGLPIWNKADILHPTMGYTSSLWMTLNSIQALFTNDKDIVVIVSKYWSLIFFSGFSWYIISMIQKQNIDFMNKVLFTILLLWNPVFGFHISSGMETILFSSTLSLYAILAMKFKEKYKTMIVFGLLLFFIRPEGILALGVFWFIDLYLNKDYKKSFLSASFILVILAAYFSIIYNFYGYPLPSAFYVKQGSGPLIKSAAVNMAGVFLLFSALPYMLYTFLIRKDIKLKDERFIFILLVLYFSFYLTVAPLMNLVYRYQLPILFLFIIIAATHLQSFYKLPKIARYSVILVILLTSIFNLGVTGKYTSKISQSVNNLKSIGLFLNKFANEDDWLMYHDAGYICYYSDMNSIDSVGLNTIDIATKEKDLKDYYQNKMVKYILANRSAKDVESLDKEHVALDYGFAYIGAVPISNDNNERYFVRIYQRGGQLTEEDIKNIKVDETLKETWFDSLYYLGRKIIKGR